MLAPAPALAPAPVKDSRRDHHFWLVATLDSCRIDTVSQMATTKIFLKFHWQDDTFIDKVRNGKRKFLSSELGAGELADGLSKGERYVATLNDAASDHPSETFPVNIDAVFQNQTCSEKMANLCWVSYDDANKVVNVSDRCEKANHLQQSAHVVITLHMPMAQAQIALNVTVCAPMRLHAFPYDRHVIPFYMATRAWKDRGVKHQWLPCMEWPEWAPNEYSEDKVMLSEKQSLTDTEFQHKQCSVFFGKQLAKPMLCLHVERRPGYFVWRVALPVFIVVRLRAHSCV
jgi:hypothetical protein